MQNIPSLKYQLIFPENTNHALSTHKMHFLFFVVILSSLLKSNRLGIFTLVCSLWSDIELARRLEGYKNNHQAKWSLSSLHDFTSMLVTTLEGTGIIPLPHHSSHLLSVLYIIYNIIIHCRSNLARNHFVK